MKTIASIIFDDHIEKSLDYEIPKNLQADLKPGMRIEAPLRGFLKKGYVYLLKENSDVRLLKPIHKIVSAEIISKDLFSLALFLSDYYNTSLSKVLKCMVPSSIRKEIQKKEKIFLTPLKSKKQLLEVLLSLQKKHPAQAAALELILKTKKGIYLSDLLKKGSISQSPVDSLIKKKLIKAEKIDADFLLDEEFFQVPPKTLNEEQIDVLNKIYKSQIEQKFIVHLLFGITGSGKTEIYLSAIEKALSLNRGVIMLVPEVALTSQTIERFKSRFQEKIALLHHKRSHGERTKAWQDILDGKIKIAIGARSCVFAPVKNLGLIIVDEEHDSSYKQTEEQPTYHARNVAVMRGKLGDFPVILGSATPSFESYFLAEKNKYLLSKLTKRAASASLPDVHVIDMKEEIKKTKSLFSNPLLKAIKSRFEKGEQTLLFLNRRGYHSFLFCSHCSTSVRCIHCDIALTYHKKKNLLICHYCGYEIPPIKTCPACSKEGFLQYKGYGTELVESALKAIFPEIKTLRLDRDTTTQKHSHEMLFKQFKAGKADVLIGTQMIVKGLHFPSVTLVGVLNTDGALNLPDFRSSESVFQLLCQVAGRAGRASLKGEVFIQTFMPKNRTVLLAAEQDFTSFYNQEINERKLFEYPPFLKMVKITFFGTSEEKTKAAIEKFRENILRFLPNDVIVHPVLASGHAKIQDKYRFFFLLRGKSVTSINKALKSAKKEQKIPSCVHSLIDVDPLFTFF